MFELPPLPFSENALEPAMSRDTLATHYGEHHAAYIKKTNTLLEKKHWNETSLESVVRRAHQEQEQKLFNNAAQAWNHAFFWQSLTPKTQGGPEGRLAEAINGKWGSVAKLRDVFLSKGEEHFASGWLWLCIGADKDISLIDLHDAQTPIVDTNVTPLLTCDLWEHAYYLDHKNERPAYLKTVFDQLLNWRFAEAQFAAAHNSGGWTFASSQDREPQRRAQHG
jgi:Fe-Mn family superoxide dismutase